MKTENNLFKGYIETLLDVNNNTDESISFKKNLNSLREALVGAAIVTQERGGVNQQISFSEIAINNPKTLSEGTPLASPDADPALPSRLCLSPGAYRP